MNSKAPKKPIKKFSQLLNDLSSATGFFFDFVDFRYGGSFSMDEPYTFLSLRSVQSHKLLANPLENTPSSNQIVNGRMHAAFFHLHQRNQKK